MDPILALVERSNQRGGRMLSVIDLIEAGTLQPRMAAWLLARIEARASWLVGAVPGGAGKTAVMSALLAMLPEGETARLAVEGTGWEASRAGECVVAYEISAAPYEAYIWGGELRRFARLGANGCRLVTNLHADTLDQARDQIVGDCGASESDFAAFGMFLPIRLYRTTAAVRREVAVVHYVDVDGAWRVFDGEEPPSPRETAIEAFLEETRERNLRTVSEVRSAWLEWQSRNPN